jgi:hypothetical protein
MALLWVSERDQRLELVVAHFAFPQMLYAVPIQICGPFREEHRLPAAKTFTGQVWGLTIGKLHRASSIINWGGPAWVTADGLSSGAGINHRAEPRPLCHVWITGASRFSSERKRKLNGPSPRLRLSGICFLHGMFSLT